MTQTADAAGPNVIGVLTFVLISAPLLAWPVSIFLLKLYKRSVVRSMRLRPSGEEFAAAESGSDPPPAPLEIKMLEPSSETPMDPEARSLYAHATGDPWRAAMAYAAGGFCYSLILAAAFLMSSGTPILPLRLLVLTWAYFWPAVLILNLVAAVRRRVTAIIVGVYGVIYFALGFVGIRISPELTFGQLIKLWVLMALIPSLLFLGFTQRRIRAVGPVVLAFMLLAIAGPTIVLPVAGSRDAVLRKIARIGTAFGLGGDAIFYSMILFGVAVAVIVGWTVLRWIGRLYVRKSISDQSIMLDSMWIFFGFAQSLDLLLENAKWILATAGGFLVYKIVTSLALRLAMRRVRESEGNSRLLLLRVFSLGDRSQRLFDALTKRWRYVGSIHLISGPDLATTTIEPHEFMEFVAGKLRHLFIDSTKTLEQRIAVMDESRDRDGRFRVNDFFCYDNTWKAVLARLAGDCDVVLMDLRGFTSSNAGCIFEIGALMNSVPLARVVFVIDRTTDEALLETVLRDAWRQLARSSPNRDHTEPLQLLKVGEQVTDGLRRVLMSLSMSSRTVRITPSAQKAAEPWPVPLG
jgi:hypothetical protein